MAEMTVTVTMAPEDFQEFMAWKKTGNFTTPK